MTLRLRGSTSQYVDITASPNAGDATLTLPATTGTVRVAGGAGVVDGDYTVATGATISGYTNAIDFSTDSTHRLRLDPSGRLMLGTTTEGYENYADNFTIADSAHCGLTIRSGTTSQGNIYFSDGASNGSEEYEGIIQYLHDVNAMAFGVNNGVERMRLDSSGRLLINSGSDVRIELGTNGTTGTNDRNHLRADGDNLKYNTCENGNHIFEVNGDEKAHISSTGNLTIGAYDTSPYLRGARILPDNSGRATFVLNGDGTNNTAIGVYNGNTSAYNLKIMHDGGIIAAGTAFQIDGNGVMQTNLDSAGIIRLNSTGTFSGTNKVVLSSVTGNATFTGALSKGSGSFKIDHPLVGLTTSHHLVHSFIEGPQADLIYRGVVDLVDGTATVNIDTAGRMTEGTFAALCTNVSCFTSNESDWTAVKGSVTGNVLTITAQDNTSTVKVSWMVVGERKDQHMIDTDWTDDAGRVITEPLKS